MTTTSEVVWTGRHSSYLTVCSNPAKKTMNAMKAMKAEGTCEGAKATKVAPLARSCCFPTFVYPCGHICEPAFFCSPLPPAISSWRLARG